MYSNWIDDQVQTCNIILDKHLKLSQDNVFQQQVYYFPLFRCLAYAWSKLIWIKCVITTSLNAFTVHEEVLPELWKDEEPNQKKDVVNIPLGVFFFFFSLSLSLCLCLAPVLPVQCLMGAVKESPRFSWMFGLRYVLRLGRAEESLICSTGQNQGKKKRVLK